MQDAKSTVIDGVSRSPQRSGTQQQGTRNPGLENLFGYPLMAALTERRTRRVARGTSIRAGDVSYTSSNAPLALSALEEAILVVATAGITGSTMHDGCLDKSDGKQELGTPFLNVLNGTSSSADNCQSTSFFMINDEGIWLLKQPRGLAALELMKDLPGKWSEWSENDWLETAKVLKVRVSDRRLEFPRQYPYYLGWNAQTSNVPGTTVFFPVVDCTRQYINAILILANEAEGQRPMFIDDWQKFRPKTFQDWLAWAAMKIGLVEKIPYHPVGGIKRVKSGWVNKDNVAPIGWAHTFRTDYGAFFQFQNIMLLAQAMGLGGWIHGSVFAPYIFQRDESKGWHGLGFRMEAPVKEWSAWPPVPTTQPNPVGIDGILEGLCPPYVSSMSEAVDIVIEEKYSSSGPCYGNKQLFGTPYKNQEYADSYLRQATRHSPGAVEYAKEICNYIWDTYGRFPAHIDAFYTPGMFLQVANLELEYYEKFYKTEQFERQRAHDVLWGTNLA
jgi:hypothetical protein